MKRDAALLDRPVIAPYKPVARGIAHDRFEDIPQHRVRWDQDIEEMGGLHPRTKKWTPLHNLADNDPSFCDVLDHITAAVEAGVIEQFNWAEQLFATLDDRAWFFEQLEGYDECYRITDRWWTALAKLDGAVDEEGFITCADIAESLQDRIENNKKEQRNQVLRAEYLQANPPPKPLKLTKAEAEALRNANWKLLQKPDVEPDHYTVGIPFKNKFLYIKNKEAWCREATREDVDAVMKKAAKAK